jgi:lipopolysaccharide export system protein LptA
MNKPHFSFRAMKSVQKTARKKSNTLAQAMLAAMLMHTPLSYGLDSDRTQPVEVLSDSATLDERAQTAIYTGNVHLTQGSLNIRANKLIIKLTQDSQVRSATATGSPASFTQIPEPEQPPVHATANNIHYLLKENILHLKRKARITQGSNLFQGEDIRYNMATQQITADGDSDGNDATSSGRVKMVLPPPPPRDDASEGFSE